jgi:hypothetical protein
VFLANEYGVSVDGLPVYPEYNDDVHTSKKPLGVIDKLPIVVRPGLRAHAGCGVCADHAARAVPDHRRALRVRHRRRRLRRGHPEAAHRDALPEGEIMFVGDPAGMAKESDERSAFDVLADHGVVAVPAHTNRLTGRLEAVKHYLGRMVDGQPALIVDPKCERIREGFIGKYHYKRVQVGGERFKDMPEKDSLAHRRRRAVRRALCAHGGHERREVQGKDQVPGGRRARA